MTKQEFKALVFDIVNNYDVASFIDNITEDMTTEDIDEDLWFNCPNCGEPILYEDYADDICIFDDQGLYIYCPVCNEYIEIE